MLHHSLLSVLFIVMIQSGFSQQVISKKTKIDSLYIISHTDEMSEKTYIYPSREIICMNEDSTKGFTLNIIITSNLSMRALVLNMRNIGNCSEKNELIFLFDDNSKLTIKSFSDFTCKETSFFNLDKEDVLQLASKKVTKIKATNGYTFDSFTSPVNEKFQDYFLKVSRMLSAKQIFILRD